MPRNTENGSRLVTTCTECKQAKLRCDSKSKFPASCSRCHTRGLVCTVDSTFRRVPARQRLSELTRELHELRSQQCQEPSSAATATEYISYGDDYAMEQQLQDDLTFSENTASLKGVVVDGAIILKAFQTFTDAFRPQFPIVGAVSVDTLYRSQPLLFWTIVTLTVSRLPDHDCIEAFRRVRAVFESTLHEQIFVAPLPLHKIQVLLLLCQWPLPVDTQPHDPSWLYAGLALQASRIMSLGRQEVITHMQSLGLGSTSILNRINTWLGCFYVSVSLAMHLGLTPSMEYELEYPTIQTFLRHQTTTLVFSMKVKAIAIAAKYTPLLRQAVNDGTTTAIVRLLETDLDSVGADVTASSEQSLAVEVAVLDVKLHLYSFVLISTLSQLPSDRQVILHKALGVALRVVQLYTGGLAVDAVQHLDSHVFMREQRCVPKGRGRTLAFAAIFLLRFSHHTTSQTPDERRHITNSIRLAQDFFKSCALEPSDEYARTAKLLEVLETDISKQSHLQVLCLTHRMGYSIMLDAMKKGAEVRGKPSPIQDDEALDDSSARTEPIWGSSALESTADFSVTGFQADWCSDFSWEFWGDPFIGTSVPFEDGT